MEPETGSESESDEDAEEDVRCADEAGVAEDYSKNNFWKKLKKFNKRGIKYFSTKQFF